LLDAASIRAVGNVQFRGYFLMGKNKQPIATHWLVQSCRFTEERGKM
jgi:hypothetical protein